MGPAAVGDRLHTLCVVVLGRCRWEVGEIPGTSNVRKRKTMSAGQTYVTGGCAGLVTWVVMFLARKQS